MLKFCFQRAYYLFLDSLRHMPPNRLQEVNMDVQELRKFKVELLDDIRELATEPVADPEPIKRKLDQYQCLA